ncbi:hypothetical protein G4B88_000707 [Cannabis sativa]|uniref:SWIM-type domain-containing protein n=1 Tax=Cannabis sativa TaxID=3483 RepID=A0A7J6DWU1_CANSA|nr:hypothetical protein G4B88_000707 [Cannabis sativa]
MTLDAWEIELEASHSPKIQQQILDVAIPEADKNEPMPHVAPKFDTHEYMLAESETIMEGDFMQYDSGGNFTLGASSSVAPRRLKYAPRRASTRPNEMSISEANGESLSRSTDDSDLEWRKENEISYDDEDSSDLDKYCDESDTEEWFGEHYDSDEAEHKNFRRLSRNENFVDPNSKLPRPKNENIYENGKIVLRQWQRFKDHKVFGAVLKDFAIQEGFELRKVKHASSRITSVCRAEGCKWQIHASLSPDEREFIIKTYNPDHNCQCVVKNRIATSGWIAKKLSSTLAKTPDMNLQRMRLELKDQFGIEATNRQLWKARQKAREHGGFNYAHSYGNLRRYAAMIYKTNPGSAAIIQTDRWEHKLTPKVHLKVQEIQKKARFALVTRVGNEEFQVDYGKKRCIVRLNEFFCICGQWQVRGIPCIHAIACITTIRADIANYCSPYFTTEMWRKTFEQCSNCHEFGHNSRSCKKPIPCLSQPLAQPIKDKSKGKGKKKENTTCQGIGNVPMTYFEQQPVEEMHTTTTLMNLFSWDNYGQNQ